MTMNNNIIYNNGNCAVNLDLWDGTKIRSCDGQPTPEFPESIDLKITNWCDAGCHFCHEQSTKLGKHADIDDIFNALEGLPRGVEIAIGGGNPWSHPNIVEILLKMKEKGFIANVTMNEFHLNNNGSTEKDINCFTQRKLIHGLGISIDDQEPLFDWKLISQDIQHRIVAHVIVGVTSPFYVRQLPNWVKVLVLGYKDVGRGESFKKLVDINNRTKEWCYWLSTVAKDRIILFDNLAIKQLQVQKRLPDELWDSRYMGDDGQFTMYIDAVEREYAVSSASSRYPLMGQSAKYWFKNLNSTNVRN